MLIPLFVTEMYSTINLACLQKIDWNKAESSLDVCQSVKEVSWAAPGTKAGLQMLEDFCKKRLKNYHSQSNDPNADALSNLSPWLHFGMCNYYV